jgi:hypothetical protein
MSLSYQNNKEAIYRWRENHPDKYYECNKQFALNWIENNKERYRECCKLRARKYQAKKRDWKSISKIYFQILLEV